MSSENETTLPGPEHTHVIFVKNAATYTGLNPFFSTDIKKATDECDIILNSNAGSCCMIYQLRTTLQSKIEIQRQDFNIK